MRHEIKYPVEFRASHIDANDVKAPCMCHVFDYGGYIALQHALTRVNLHVIAWDADGEIVFNYDNR